MGQVQEIKVDLPHDALPNPDWADAWQTSIPKRFQNAREAAETIIANFPKSTNGLLLLRQIIVFPFGLIGASEAKTFKRDMVGIFPVVSETTDQLVAGFDDKHLDFRIVVDLWDVDGNQNIRLSTIIMRHNLLGKAYLQMVLPFHRWIIKSALRKLTVDK